MRRPVMPFCVLALAGCGGDGGGGERLSKSEFSAQGDKICREGRDEMQKKLQEEAGEPEFRDMPAEKQQVHLATTAMPVMERAMSRIEDLGAPEEYEEHVEKLAGGMRDLMDLFEDTQGADESEAEELAQRLKDLQAQTRTAAKATGLEACLPTGS